ncbi:MAG TPA: CPBP family glutamic-type intramembrane protease [Gemmatimonadales bacterium]|nr:CPBP family glutamic-type intramembrane protease [Gemmatimonadales bacterium]
MNYWQLSRSPRYSVLFAAPLLLAYELTARVLTHGDAGVRNGADVMLKSLFVWLGGRDGILLFDLLLAAVGIALIWRDRRAGGAPLRWRVFALMLGEAVVLAVAFGFVASLLTALILNGPSILAIQHRAAFDVPTQLMVSLGAGIYEELLFRVLIVSGLVVMGRRVFGWGPGWSNAFAVVIGAVVFSAFHYIGPYGDPLQLPSFVFRAVAGLLFSGLYVLRGYGVTAWTHSLYDIFLTIATR